MVLRLVVQNSFLLVGSDKNNFKIINQAVVAFMKIFLHTILPYLSFSLARFAIIQSKPKLLRCKSYILFTIHLTRYQANQAPTITFKTMFQVPMFKVSLVT